MEESVSDSILEEILLPPSERPERRFRWFEQLPDPTKAKLLEAKSLWKAGSIRMTPYAMSRRVMNALRSRNLPSPGSHTTISDWLRQ